jgi:flagellar biosynthesis protein
MSRDDPAWRDGAAADWPRPSRSPDALYSRWPAAAGDSSFTPPARRQVAVALGYDSGSGDTAPRVLAKGYGQIAERIVERAREAGLYIHHSPEMVSLLMQVDLDAHIPPALYQAVAELLAWLYGLEHAQAALPAVKPASA